MRMLAWILLALFVTTTSALANPSPPDDRYYDTRAGVSSGHLKRIPESRRWGKAHSRKARSLASGFAREVRRAGRPAAWCGWWLGQHLGIGDRKLWVARNWASVGSNAGRPGVGVVVVWRHHVGIITGQTEKGWVVKSGNDGHAVRERVRSVSGAIAFRSL